MKPSHIIQSKLCSYSFTNTKKKNQYSSAYRGEIWGHDFFFHPDWFFYVLYERYSLSLFTDNKDKMKMLFA